VRDDSGAEAQSEVSIDYDPLISKLAVWGTDRAQTIARLKRALREYRVLGIRTTVPFFRWILDQPAFHAGAFHTGSLDELLQLRQGAPFEIADEAEEDVAASAAALHAAARIGFSGRVGFSGRDGRINGGNVDFANHVNASTRAPVRRPGEGWKRQARLGGLRA
jgi:acetyl/propionyl-CoA carboxylase alpha subunit